MSDEEIRRKLVDFLERIAPGSGAGQVAPGEDLREALDLDSMDFLRFVQLLKAELGVEVPEREYPAIRTLDGCAAYVAAHT